ncbi:MAG: hypothetical protein JW915_10235, partial [Chitinispirillaceae bacterium]|nr:hypothetical protein [Chitinispirillaceae bacterium]
MKKIVSTNKLRYSELYPLFSCFRIFLLPCLTFFFTTVSTFSQTFTISSSNPSVAGTTLSASSTNQIIYVLAITASGGGA